MNDAEIIWCEVHAKQGKFLLGLLYRPPNSPMGMWDKIQLQLSTAIDTGLEVVLGGNFNEDLLTSPNKLEDLCIKCGVEPLDGEATHTTATSSKCIDVVLTNAATTFSHVSTTSPSMSNHAPVVITRGNPTTHRPTIKRKVFLYEKTNWDHVNEVLSTADWPTMNERTDLNAAAETWTHIVKNAVHAYTPTKISQSDRVINAG